MGNLRACSVIALLAACGSSSNPAQIDAHVVAPDAAVDAKIFNDAPAPVFDFSCVNNGPMTATATITVGGTVQEVSGSITSPTVGALQGASVDMCAAGAINCTGANHYGTTATTDALGAFSIGPVSTTSSMPIDAYLTMTKTGDRTTYVYPGQPLTKDEPAVPVLTFPSAFLTLVQMSSKGVLGVAITDCAGSPITDTTHITLSIVQNGTDIISTLSPIDASTFNAAAAGAFIVFNVPPNATTTVGATYTGKSPSVTMRAHDVQVVAGTSTETIVRPGY